MRSLDYLFGKINWNIDFNTQEVKEALKRVVDSDYSVDELIELVMPTVNLISSTELDSVKSGLRNVISSYRSDRRVTHNATEVLSSLNDLLQSVKRDVSNSLCFGLDKANYTKDEIRALNELVTSLKEFRSQVNLKQKYNCSDCDDCVSNGLKGCKIQNNETRARQWGILI